jgi:ferredoxin
MTSMIRSPIVSFSSVPPGARFRWHNDPSGAEYEKLDATTCCPCDDDGVADDPGKHALHVLSLERPCIVAGERGVVELVARGTSTVVIFQCAKCEMTFGREGTSHRIADREPLDAARETAVQHAARCGRCMTCGVDVKRGHHECPPCYEKRVARLNGELFVAAGKVAASLFDGPVHLAGKFYETPHELIVEYRSEGKPLPPYAWAAQVIMPALDAAEVLELLDDKYPRENGRAVVDGADALQAFVAAWNAIQTQPYWADTRKLAVVFEPPAVEAVVAKHIDDHTLHGTPFDESLPPAEVGGEGGHE